MKRIKLLILISLSASLISNPTFAAVKAGSSCSKLNSTSTVAGIKYTCIKSGNKLIWNLGVKIGPTAKPVCTQQTISALLQGARQVNINQAGAQAAWKNYLETRNLVLQYQYTNMNLSSSYSSLANRWYRTAQENLASADSLRESFNRLNALCSPSYVNLPERVVLYDPMNDPNNWREIPSFVEPDISVSFSNLGTRLTCNKPWAKKWKDELVGIGYSLYSVSPNNFNVNNVDQIQMGNSPGFSFDRSKNIASSSNILELVSEWAFESGDQLCGKVLAPPNIPEILKSELKKDAVSIAVWLIIQSPKPASTKLDVEWWGKLLRIELISNTPFPNKSTVFEAKVGAPAPGGGFIGYVAPTTQSWGRFIEVATIPGFACIDASSRISIAQASGKRGPNIPCKDSSGNPYSAIFDDLAQNFENCSGKLISYNGVGRALLATKQLAELCDSSKGKQGLAKLIYDLNWNGFDDWFLPTEDEVRLILGASKDLKRCLVPIYTDGRAGGQLITSTISNDYLGKPLVLMGVDPTERTCTTGQVSGQYAFSPPTAGGSAFMIRYYP